MRTVFACAVGAFVGVVALASAALATPAITFNEASGGNAINQAQSVGWQFDVLSPVTVTGLGWYDEFQDGLGVGHTVGIWNPAGTLLTSAFVPAGTAAGLDGVYRTVGVTSITLPVGQGYIVGGENFDNSGDRLTFDVTQSTIPEIRYFDATFSALNSGFTRPTNFSGATTGFYGAMFSVVIPEPSSLAALGLGSLTLLRRRRA